MEDNWYVKRNIHNWMVLYLLFDLGNCYDTIHTYVYDGQKYLMHMHSNNH